MSSSDTDDEMPPLATPSTITTDVIRTIFSMSSRNLLFHSRCIICEQFENATKNYIVTHARNQLNPESTEDIDVMYHAVTEMWLEHHIEDAVESFRSMRNHVSRLEQALEESADDAHHIESATDEMISTLHKSTCSEKTGESCSICLMEIECDDTLMTTNCEHTFHEKCITTWLQTNIQCPLCRCNAITG